MESMDSFVQLGRRMVEFDVSRADLESRINALGHAVSPEQAKAIVTGYVDAALEDKSDWRTEQIYLLVNGWARWLYNGSLDTVKDRIYERLAKRALVSESYEQETARLLQNNGDAAGLQKIAQLVVDEKPHFALSLADEKSREALQRRVVNLHFHNDQYKHMVAHCLEELKEHEAHRKLGFFYQQKDLQFALKLLDGYHKNEDYFVLANNMKDADPVMAYKIILQTGCWEEPNKSLAAELRDILINKKPALGLKAFSEHTGSAYPIGNAHYWTTNSGHGDATALLAIGKRLLELDKPDLAMDAFGEIGLFYHQTVPAECIVQAGLKLLRRLPGKEALSDKTQYNHRQAMEKAARQYFAEGGDAEITDALVDTVCIEDSLGRKLGHALAKLPPERDAAYRAYHRLRPLKDKTRNDEQTLDRLRHEILDEKRTRAGAYLSQDPIGLRMFADRFKKEAAELVYPVALELKDSGLIAETRQYLMKENLRKALGLFEKKDDAEGIALAKAQLAPGVPLEISDALLGMKK